MQIDALHLPFASGVVLNYGCFCHGKCEITSPTFYEMISKCNAKPLQHAAHAHLIGHQR